MHREEPMETLNLWGCGIGTEEMKRLQRGLHRCKELVLSENEIRGSGLRLLADGMLEREGSLETLQLYRCLLMDKSGSSLSVILKANKGLKNLGLTLNEIGDSGLRLLADGMLEREGSLETLELYRCLLMDKSGSSLSVILKANKGLKNLGLTLNEIGDSGLRLLADGMLEREGSLETLELYWCLLMDKSGSSLSVILKANKGLKNLGLTLNEIGDSGLRLLADGMLEREGSLETLELYRCLLMDKSGSSLSVILKANKGLKNLGLTLNEIGDSGLRLLADGMLEREGSLETLELYRCLLMDKSGSSLSVILKANKGLKNLGLTLNEIGDSGLRLLADGMLEREGSLETLELYRCLLMDKSGSSLSVILKANKGLKNLGLTLNEIGDSGLRLLADGMLEREGSLETLELYRCLLMDKSGSSLSVILKANKGLKNLGLTLNEIGDSGLRLLADGMLEREGSLETLDLRRCPLTDKSGSSLSVILNTGLKILRLSYNKIGDSGLQLIADGMFRREGSLETLFLIGCSLKDKSIPALHDIIITNKALRELRVECNDFSEEGKQELRSKWTPREGLRL
ncbi:ribonuclease inhibitor-like isoform X1 [Petromyzon marinus]|uniref:ribonuclease inhibitor-like isoform X1 n=1 Tax=Petromyzon marinus TaxID=7757 RepID=UPI003F7275D1